MNAEKERSPRCVAHRSKLQLVPTKTDRGFFTVFGVSSNVAIAALGPHLTSGVHFTDNKMYNLKHSTKYRLQLFHISSKNWVYVGYC